MKLSNEMKNRILSYSDYLLDEDFGWSFNNLKKELENALKRYVSAYESIQDRKKLLEKYPDYMTPTNEIILVIPVKGNRCDVEFKFKLDFEFAQSHRKGVWGYETNRFWITMTELEGEARKLADDYKERLEENKEIYNKLNSILNRVTTSNQLLKEFPICGIFFDDEGQFYIPDFKNRK